IFMHYYFIFIAALLLAIVVVFISMAALFGVRMYCPTPAPAPTAPSAQNDEHAAESTPALGGNRDESRKKCY
ncbi:hypothetical protein ABK046_53330, partial [Streptomyces caeruleatus]